MSEVLHSKLRFEVRCPSQEKCTELQYIYFERKKTTPLGFSAKEEDKWSMSVAMEAASPITCFNFYYPNFDKEMENEVIF